MSIILHIAAIACIVAITVCATLYFKEKGKQAVVNLLSRLIPTIGATIICVAFFWLLFLAPTNIY